MEKCFCREKGKKKCFRPGSNWGPCACEAHVITTTLRKQLLIGSTKYHLYRETYSHTPCIYHWLGVWVWLVYGCGQNHDNRTSGLTNYRETPPATSHLPLARCGGQHVHGQHGCGLSIIYYSLLDSETMTTVLRE